MNPSSNLTQNRNDLSPYLFHFTKGEKAFETLLMIFQELMLKSKTHEYICLTETPITQFIENLIYMNRYNNPMFSMYGIGFNRDLLISKYGARPVIYGNNEDLDKLKKIDMDWRFELLNIDYHDFTWLREWRIRNEFDFSKISPNDIIIIAKTKDELEQICAVHELEDLDFEYEPEIGECTIYPIYSVIRGWKGISIDDLMTYKSDKEVYKKALSQKIGEYLL